MILQLLLLLLIAGICGALGQAIGGYSHGGCLVSIALGFIGALLVDRFGSKMVGVLPLLMALGMGSVVQWGLSEQHGQGDLRWYALYQGMVMIFAAELMLMFPSREIGVREFAIAAIANVAAKIFELLDVPIYQLGGIVSGHTLKHLSASLGFIPLVMMVWKKKAVSTNG